MWDDQDLVAEVSAYDTLTIFFGMAVKYYQTSNFLKTMELP
jgi:hypothetical protein